jgi:hypothetical protein
LAAHPQARLRIHTAGGLPAGGAVAGWLQALLHWRVLAGRASGESPWPRAGGCPVSLLVEDLQGHRFLAVDRSAPLTEVPLPAGTYHVTAQRGEARRRYTVTLEHGSTFDLVLRLATVCR